MLVTRLIPDYSFEEKLDAQKKAVARFASAGITSLVNTGEDRENVLVLQELWRRKELVVRWHLALAYEANGDETEALGAADHALETLASQRETLRKTGGDPKEEPEWAAEARAMKDRLQPATASN